jgi:hypothetical protein
MALSLEALNWKYPDILNASFCDLQLITIAATSMISQATLLLASLLGGVQFALAQSDTLGLSRGTTSLSSDQFNFELVTQSQTLFSLVPSGASIDYIPGDVMSERAGNLNYHVGDITFRVRESGASQWISGDSSSSRVAVTPLDASGNTLAAADLSPTLPSNSLLNVTRRWELNDDGELQLLFEVGNAHSASVYVTFIDFVSPTEMIQGDRCSWSAFGI